MGEDAGRLDRIAAALRQEVEVMPWLVRHHDAFAAMLTAGGPPRWDRIAAVLAGEGLQDARGKPPTPEGARKAWLRARQVVAARKGKPAPARTRAARKGRGERRNGWVDAPPPADVRLVEPEPAAPAPAAEGAIADIRRQLAARSGVTLP